MAGRQDNLGGVQQRVERRVDGGNRGRWVLVVLTMMPVLAWMAARWNDACEASGVIW